MRRLEALILLLLGGVLASGAAWASQKPAPDSLPKLAVQDLHTATCCFISMWAMNSKR